MFDNDFKNVFFFLKIVLTLHKSKKCFLMKSTFDKCLCFELFFERFEKSVFGFESRKSV
jgi:hypothetical protein